MNIKLTRRENLRALAKSVGGITRLADRLNKTQSQISHLIGSNPIKNIGDRIAAQVEESFNKPSGWLDKQHQSIETELSPYPVEKNSQQTGILCRQIPLISWEDVKQWNQAACSYKAQNGDHMVPTTVNVGPLAFALYVYGDHMESPTGISFPENSIIIADPDGVPVLGSFVIVRISKDRGATLKQLITQGHKRYLKPLNRRYPILEFTSNTIVLGVVKQMVINFDSFPVKPRVFQIPQTNQRTIELV